SQDVVLFNTGDGSDTIEVSAQTAAFTLSLGGELRPEHMWLNRQGADLVLQIGQGSADRVVFDGWYRLDSVPAVSLQLVMSGAPGFDPTSSDVLRNQHVVHLDFNEVVAAFDSHGRGRWKMEDGLAGA